MLNIIVANARPIMKAFTPIAVALAVLVFLFSGKASAETEFKEGVHYTEYTTPVSKRPIVVEYFSVFCPACNNFNKYQQQITDSIPSNTTKRRVHVDFLKGADPQGMKEIAKVVALTELYSTELKTNPVDDLFDVIHIHNSNLNTVAVQKIISVHDELNKDIDLIEAFNSEKVERFAHASTMNQSAMQQAGALSSVPTLMVNGRYKVNLSALSRDRAFAELNELITFLNKKHF
ncbi:thioredoxin domain-containing protein [Idiomarina sp.]|uniref:thioredoxin domain-containing protein n=1 Tax=Idiomarina sp. TaxID=1874361 RepID=UPI0025C484ED|nr:thioredoxin domain-containing protein [Idiomarina sp.]